MYVCMYGFLGHFVMVKVGMELPSYLLLLLSDYDTGILVYIYTHIYYKINKSRRARSRGEPG